MGNLYIDIVLWISSSLMLTLINAVNCAWFPKGYPNAAINLITDKLQNLKERERLISVCYTKPFFLDPVFSSVLIKKPHTGRWIWAADSTRWAKLNNSNLRYSSGIFTADILMAELSVVAVLWEEASKPCPCNPIRFCLSCKGESHGVSALFS